MAQVFTRAADLALRAGLVGAGLAVAGAAWLAWAGASSSWATGVGQAPEQPVPFSHRHHVGDVGLDCRTCHESVETSAFAGIPPTQTCMTCHSQLWSDAALLAPVRDSWASGEPIPWVRVHRLPDHVLFDHSAHVLRGVGCVTCHGRVDEMALTRQAEPLLMRWCLDCHENPERFVRPPEAVFDLAWAPEDQAVVGRQVVRDLGLAPTTTCTGCHR